MRSFSHQSINQPKLTDVKASPASLQRASSSAHWRLRPPKNSAEIWGHLALYVTPMSGALELLCRLCPMRHSEFRWRPIVASPYSSKSGFDAQRADSDMTLSLRTFTCVYRCDPGPRGAMRTLLSSSRDSTVARVRGMQCRKVRPPLQSVRIPSSSSGHTTLLDRRPHRQIPSARQRHCPARTRTHGSQPTGAVTRVELPCALSVV